TRRVAASPAGSYSWLASDSGAAKDKEAQSGCADEPVTVGQAGPEVKTTQDPAAATVGATFKDKATISGLFGEHPGGSISWKLYDNPKCEGQALASDGPVTVSGNGDYETPHGPAPTAGTYYWVASYSGDANDKEAQSGCADEPVTVGHPPAAVVAQATVVPQAKVVSGVATPHGPLECVAATARTYIEGRQIASATFYLDGHKM